MAQNCGYCRSSISDGDAFCQICGRPASAPANGLGILSPNPEPPVAAMPTGRMPMWANAGPPVGMPPAPVRSVPSAAAAPGGPDDAYMSGRMAYRVPPEPPFDPLRSGRVMAQMALRYLFYQVASLLGYVVFVILTLLINPQALVWPFTMLASAATPVTAGVPGPGLGINAGGVLLSLLWFGYGATLVICFWFLKVPIQLSEWKITIDGKGPAAPAVFNHIAAALYNRRTPIEPLRVQRFRLPRTGYRDYLELHSGLFYGYVACFEYGQDLYVGWTFWCRLSPFHLVWMFIMRLFRSLSKRGNDLYDTLRYDYARAMRETLHNTTRQGVDFAVAATAAPEPVIVGSAIPVMENPAF
jgi:hypothetical protein